MPHIFFLLLCVLTTNASHCFAYAELRITHTDKSTVKATRAYAVLQLILPGSVLVSVAQNQEVSVEVSSDKTDQLLFVEAALKYRGSPLTDALVFETDFLTLLGADGWEVIFREPLRFVEGSEPTKTDTVADAENRPGPHFGDVQTKVYLLKRRVNN